MKHIVIVGNGVAGITAARHIRKRSAYKITVISAETKYFFSRTALMYVYMGHMKFEHTQPYENNFWEKNNIDLIQDLVIKIDNNKKTLTLQNNDSVVYDDLILATGSVPNKFGWPGQDLQGVQGLYSYQDLQKLEEKTPTKAVIVGGGLIGIELAEMLLYKKVEVTLLVREKSFWSNVLPSQESALINQLIQKHHIDLKLESELKCIHADSEGWVQSIETVDGTNIPCDFVGLTAGVSPNIGWLKDSDVESNRGILVDPYLRSNMANIYAIGDCAEHRTPPPNRRPIEQVWYTGRMMGETVAATITGNPTTYQPGPWFNSAKFFDLEYQTYGVVSNVLQAGQKEFYWEHESGNFCMHFIWNSADNKFVGVNSFGIRLRHEVLDQWLQKGARIMEVMEGLRAANFDPEFFKRHEESIVMAFNAENQNLAVKLNGKKSLIEKIFG